MNILKIPLAIIATIWYLVLRIRHFLYDKKALKSVKFDSPKIIGIGNLELGGTGKSPMTEYVIQLLYSQYNVVILSRGYGRKTKGFYSASKNSKIEEIGDEPYVFYQNWKDKKVKVAVCESRVEGVEKIKAIWPETDIVILDDCLQHRKITPSFMIALTPAKKPFYSNYLFPFGTLRDISHALKRSDVLIYTGNNQLDKNKKYQKWHSYFNVNTFQSKSIFNLNRKWKDEDIAISISGIANPERFTEFVNSEFKVVHNFVFNDHQNYDNELIRNTISKIKAAYPAVNTIITTSKDFFKLTQFDEKFKQANLEIIKLNYSLDFNEEEKLKLETLILNHVRAN
jgi:tetraacyldisaccharide 4'-kinase